MRKQFIETLKHILHSDNKTVLLLGDIGVFGFRDELKNMPNRAYNIGILEQSTVGVAAGLAKTGMIPFVHTIAPFLVERSFEQLKIDFGYQNLNGNFISVGASYDYAALGCTHHCPGDVNALLGIPNMQIVTPGTSKEFEGLLKSAYNNGHPTYFRLSETENNTDVDVRFGKGTVVRTGREATIVCYGNMLQATIDACNEKDVTVLYYTTIQPFDGQLLLEHFNNRFIIIEPFYSGSTNFLINRALEGKKYSIFNAGVPRQFLTNYGSKQEHDSFLGLDFKGLKNTINRCLTY